MQTVQKEVNSRMAEVELYLKFIREIERSPQSGARLFPSAVQSAPIFKACTFLLLYNLVESCVRSAFEQTYSEMLGEEIVYADISKEIKQVWIKQQFHTPADTATQGTYLLLASEIATLISEGKSVSLDSRKLPVSGNLDGDRIRSLCHKHGVKLTVPKWAKGGAELTTIKDQRNALAHGHKSFSECGREYGVRDLERIYRQTRHFIFGFLKSVSRFNARREYRVAN